MKTEIKIKVDDFRIFGDSRYQHGGFKHDFGVMLDSRNIPKPLKNNKSGKKS